MLLNSLLKLKGITFQVFVQDYDKGVNLSIQPSTQQIRPNSTWRLE